MDSQSFETLVSCLSAWNLGPCFSPTPDLCSSLPQWTANPMSTVGVLPCPSRGGAEVAAALPWELHVRAHTGAFADAPHLLLLDVHVRDSSWSVVGGLQSIWSISCFSMGRKPPTQARRDLLGLSDSQSSFQVREGSFKSFRLSTGASLCFINKYYLGQGIEPEIFKVLVSSLTSKLKTWYFFFLPFLFCTCLLHLQWFISASRTAAAETPTRLVGKAFHGWWGSALEWQICSWWWWGINHCLLPQTARRWNSHLPFFLHFLFLLCL